MTSSAAPRVPPGPVLRPMRATTYVTSSTRPLDQVTMRPVDTWDEHAVRRLAHGRRDHVAHLVGGRHPAGTVPTSPLVDRWVADGVLGRAVRPGVYAWTWELDGRRVRGVAAAVDLPLRGQLVPHERTRADVVADRAAQLVRSGVQAEPIVVLRDANPLAVGAHLRTGLGVDAALDLDLVDQVGLDLPGERHRVGMLRDPAAAAVVAAVAGAAPPIVADGHHRLAALDALHAEGAGPAEALVLVVDVAASDLGVGTIHRVLPGVGLDQVTRACGATLDAAVRAGAEARWLAAAAPGHLRWVLADARRVAGLDLTDDAVHALRPGWVGECSPVARDICHLHSHLLPAWGVTDTELGYVHSWEQARATATAVHGVAVRSAPPELADVLGAAREGHLLPHKATSIGPKPRIGMLMLVTEGR